MREPERIFGSIFYPAIPACPQVRIVGPTPRDEVVGETPQEDAYLLADFNEGEPQSLPNVGCALRDLECEVIVYGTGLRGERRRLRARSRALPRGWRPAATC